jgi:HYDIN/CFA65/VesB family protein/centrosomal CEP192-like protein/ASPM-SPD-2-Hydin domain-containing protein
MLLVVGLIGLLSRQGLSVNPPSPMPSPVPIPMLDRLTVAPTSISFGNVTIGTSQSQYGAITNTSRSSITVKRVVIIGTGYSVDGVTEPLTLAAGQSVSFRVLFAPTRAGIADGYVAFAVGAMSRLSGTGVAPGDLTTGPTSISFGSVLVGDSSPQAEMLKNTGGADLTVTAARVSGTGFSYAGLSLPLVLAPNQASAFSVNFAPATAGASSGNLSLTVSGSTSSVDIALSGTGLIPATLSGSAITFTNVQVGQDSTQTETVTNTGGSNAQISQVATSGTGFSVSGITTPVTLTPGQSTSFGIAFTPQSAGNFSGSVSVTSNASNSNLYVPLTGSAVAATQSTLGVSPNPISVGSVVVGLSGTQTGTLTATGANVLVSSVSLGGTNPAEFSISGLSFPVTVTTSQPVSFTVTFAPGATGAASATALFASNASNSQNAATLAGTGASPPVYTVNLSWIASTSSDVVGYNIYRAAYTNACGSYSKINSALNATTTYTDTSVVDGQTYCYVTTDVDSSDVESAYSNTAQAVISPP